MPDYDVGVLGLSSPPASAVKTTYRPAVSVSNNGIHDALASGVLRIYAAGSLVFTTELYSAVIPPGETREAQGTDYWTPDVLGDFIFTADVTCPLDEVDANNHLGPTTVTVKGGEPPPPPVVTLHAAQHEEGGPDELSIDGLRGETYDAQSPKDHATRHEQGGSDEMSVAGLHGVLADGQPTAIHGNEKHTRAYVDSDDVVAAIGVHNATTAPHPTATNLEFVIRKGAANGYAPLDGAARVPQPQLTLDLKSSRGSAAEEVYAGNSALLLEETFDASSLVAGSAIEIDLLGFYRAQLPGNPQFILEYSQDGGSNWYPAASLAPTSLPPTYPNHYILDAHFRVVVFEDTGVWYFAPYNRILAIPPDGDTIGAYDSSVFRHLYYPLFPLMLRASLIIDNIPGSGGYALDSCVRIRNPRTLNP